MVLHNLFFLVLTTAAYFSLIPLYEQLATDTGAHQVTVPGRLPNAVAQASQQSALNQARVRLFLVLGIIYLLAVVVLESAIMPWYVTARYVACWRRMRRRRPATAKAS